MRMREKNGLSSNTVKDTREMWIEENLSVFFIRTREKKRKKKESFIREGKYVRDSNKSPSNKKEENVRNLANFDGFFSFAIK